MLFTIAACSSEPEAETKEPVVPADAREPVVIEPSDATPLMWRVTCPDGQTMYLFGSMHAGEPTLYPLSNVIMDAFYAADYLAVEVDILAFYDDIAVQEEFMAMLEYEGGMTVIDEIGQELYDKAVQALLDLNLGLTMEDIEELNSYKPWVWTNDIFTTLAMQFSGLSPFFGLDLFFLDEAHELGMGILEVENLLDQVEGILGLSLEYHKAWLEETLDITLIAEALLEMYEYYRYGALEYFEAVRAEIPEAYDGLGAEFYQRLLLKRDIGMTDAIEQYFAEGKSVFYVVGLLHFVGEGGIIDLLTQRGYAVELVEIA